MSGVGLVLCWVEGLDTALGAQEREEPPGLVRMREELELVVHAHRSSVVLLDVEEHVRVVLGDGKLLAPLHEGLGDAASPELRQHAQGAHVQASAQVRVASALGRRPRRVHDALHAPDDLAARLVDGDEDDVTRGVAVEPLEGVGARVATDEVEVGTRRDAAVEDAREQVRQPVDVLVSDSRSNSKRYVGDECINLPHGSLLFGRHWTRIGTEKRSPCLVAANFEKET
mmetsp:Transcript_21978/g.37716  ORF Transcript_21978/g.37716 Transcript_21978/m.37716 type:complete len:228 (-) Transcript_21978:432-1115(-)